MKPCFDILGSMQAVRVKARGFAIVMGIFPKFIILLLDTFPRYIGFHFVYNFSPLTLKLEVFDGVKTRCTSSMPSCCG